MGGQLTDERGFDRVEMVEDACLMTTDLPSGLRVTSMTLMAGKENSRV